MNCFFLFSTTNMVFVAEAELKRNEIECNIVPTPVTDKVYCGMCVEVDVDEKVQAQKVLDNNFIEIAKILE